MHFKLYSTPSRLPNFQWRGRHCRHWCRQRRRMLGQVWTLQVTRILLETRTRSLWCATTRATRFPRAGCARPRYPRTTPWVPVDAPLRPWRMRLATCLGREGSHRRRREVPAREPRAPGAPMVRGLLRRGTGTRRTGRTRAAIRTQTMWTMCPWICRDLRLRKAAGARRLSSVWTRSCVLRAVQPREDPA